mmetsp:Transcript_3134/g.9430  ORF Transcript_3134/g.9430 Transcript_3134/m.9430 type:complete len:624 (-) Transcript_3134:1051-2922(-)
MKKKLNCCVASLQVRPGNGLPICHQHRVCGAVAPSVTPAARRCAVVALQNPGLITLAPTVLLLARVISGWLSVCSRVADSQWHLGLVALVQHVLDTSPELLPGDPNALLHLDHLHPSAFGVLLVGDGVVKKHRTLWLLQQVVVREVALDRSSLLLLAALEGIALEELGGEDVRRHLSQKFLHVVRVAARGGNGNPVSKPHGLLDGPQALGGLPGRVVELQGVVEVENNDVGGVGRRGHDLVGVAQQLWLFQPLAVWARASGVGAAAARPHAEVPLHEPILLALAPSCLILAVVGLGSVWFERGPVGATADWNAQVLLRSPSVGNDVAGQRPLGLRGVPEARDLVHDVVQDALDLLHLLLHGSHLVLVALRLLQKTLPSPHDVVEQGGGVFALLRAGPHGDGGVHPQGEVGLGAVHHQNLLAPAVSVLLWHLPQPAAVVTVGDGLGSPAVGVPQHGPRDDRLHPGHVEGPALLEFVHERALVRLQGHRFAKRVEVCPRDGEQVVLIELHAVGPRSHAGRLEEGDGEEVDVVPVVVLWPRQGLRQDFALVHVRASNLFVLLKEPESGSVRRHCEGLRVLFLASRKIEVEDPKVLRSSGLCSLQLPLKLHLAEVGLVMLTLVVVAM